MTRKILTCLALLIAFAIYDGRVTSPLGADGGGGDGPTLTWLPTLGGNSSQGYENSSNGSVVVGYSSNAEGSYRAFRWTAAGGMQDLGDFGYAYAVAYGVSGDGSVVVGEAWVPLVGQHAFRWTAADGMQDLGTLGGPFSRAADISADGLVIVGDSWDADGNNRAFRWTAASGMQDLGTLGGFDSGAYAVSADGSVVVGMAYDPNNFPQAFRWTAATGMQAIAPPWSDAFGVSADGSVVVGRAGNAFRWTAAGGMQDLGNLGGVNWAAYDVSANGSVVVGDSGGRAFRWTASTGVQDLTTIYEDSIGVTRSSNTRMPSPLMDSTSWVMATTVRTSVMRVIRPIDRRRLSLIAARTTARKRAPDPLLMRAAPANDRVPSGADRRAPPQAAGRRANHC